MRRLTRREAIAAGGAAAAGAATLGLAGCGGDDDPAPTATQSAGGGGAAGRPALDCVLTPEQTEGPFYVPDAPVRRDITEGLPGAPLELNLHVLDAQACEPVPGATVEVWHADADGIYSAFGDGSGEAFLRGTQRASDSGLATFSTIYPGWYPGRTVHIHVKVHAGGDEVHTGQLYFDDEVTDEVFASEAYAARGERDTRNETDGIYGAGGAESTISLQRSGDGYSGVLRMGVAT